MRAWWSRSRGSRGMWLRNMMRMATPPLTLFPGHSWALPLPRRGRGEPLLDLPLESVPQGGARLVERSLQVGWVVRLAVMVGDRARAILQRGLLHVGEPAVEQGQHVLRGLRVQQPPLAAAGDVDRTGMGEDAAPAAVVVEHG